MLIYITNIVGRSQRAIKTYYRLINAYFKSVQRKTAQQSTVNKAVYCPADVRDTWLKLYSPDRSRGWGKTQSFLQQCDSKPFNFSCHHVGEGATQHLQAAERSMGMTNELLRCSQSPQQSHFKRASAEKWASLARMMSIRVAQSITVKKKIKKKQKDCQGLAIRAAHTHTHTEQRGLQTCPLRWSPNCPRNDWSPLWRPSMAAFTV